MVPPVPVDPVLLAGSPPGVADALESSGPAEAGATIGAADAGGAPGAVASGATTSPVPAVPVTVTGVPVAMSIDAVALNSWVWPSALTRTLPKRPAGIDTETDAGRPTRLEVENGLVPSDRRSAPNMIEHDQEADHPADRPDEGGRAGVQVEDLGREQPADAEHRDEPEEERHQGHATDVEADMEGVEDAAEDVVDEDGDQQQAAADQGTDDEDQILDRDDHPALHPTPDRASLAARIRCAIGRVGGERRRARGA